jgi:hypothetical protein
VNHLQALVEAVLINTYYLICFLVDDLWLLNQHNVDNLMIQGYAPVYLRKVSSPWKLRACLTIILFFRNQSMKLMSSNPEQTGALLRQSLGLLRLLKSSSSAKKPATILIQQLYRGIASQLSTLYSHQLHDQDPSYSDAIYWATTQTALTDINELSEELLAHIRNMMSRFLQTKIYTAGDYRNEYSLLISQSIQDYSKKNQSPNKSFNLYVVISTCLIVGIAISFRLSAKAR